MSRLNSEKFQNFYFSPNCHFRWKIIKMIVRLNSWILRIQPIYNFKNYRNGHLQDNRGNHMSGAFVEIRDSNLVIIFERFPH